MPPFPGDSDFDDRPNRRRWQEEDERDHSRGRSGDARDDYDDAYSQTSVQERVRGPSLGFTILGWVGAFFSVLLVVGAATFPFFLPGGGPPDAWIITIIYGTLGLFCLAGSVFFIIVGSRMRQCRNWGFCLAGTIVGLASLIFLGLCSVFVLPIAIWALVVLLDDRVKREFQRISSNHSLDANDWDDR